MYFLIDKKRKIIFGWSAKCGCSHVKKLFYFLSDIKEPANLHADSYNKLPKRHYKYKIIIFIRNPYERIVSGFLNKYKDHGEFIHQWDKTKKLTFENFVNELIKGYSLGDTINKHHFIPQLSEEWDNSIDIYNIFDIKNINYKFLEQLFNKKIPNYIIAFRGKHERKDLPKYIKHKYVFQLLQREYAGFKTKP